VCNSVVYGLVREHSACSKSASTTSLSKASRASILATFGPNTSSEKRSTCARNACTWFAIAFHGSTQHVARAARDRAEFLKPPQLLCYLLVLGEHRDSRARAAGIARHGALLRVMGACHCQRRGATWPRQRPCACKRPSYSGSHFVCLPGQTLHLPHFEPFRFPFPYRWNRLTTAARSWGVELDCQERLKMLAELFETGLVVRKCGQFLVV
jgi:hypothetical protein